ncbi:MAG: hypothetical protein K1X64_19300 [Myxococcaceae bacterium]|nr:hypothetical protein [Myxococcaceae bacterium]
MRKDSVFRVRMGKGEIAALKRVAKERGQPTSEYARRLLGEQVRRDEAARLVRGTLRKARPSSLSDEEALSLADEAKHESRRR